MKNVVKTVLVIAITILLTKVYVTKVFVEPRLYNNVADTVVNHVKIDSIDFVIKYKDSIVTNIKEEYENDIKSIDTISNDSVFKLFKELCTEWK